MKLILITSLFQLAGDRSEFPSGQSWTVIFVMPLHRGLALLPFSFQLLPFKKWLIIKRDPH